eukprot:6097981-Pyramimonas_sp.AAC.1
MGDSVRNDIVLASRGIASHGALLMDRGQRCSDQPPARSWLRESRKLGDRSTGRICDVATAAHCRDD